MAADSLPSDVRALAFEDALTELETIVKQLETGKGSLDEAIHAYERGTLLKRHCEAKLKEAQERVDRIVAAVDGSVSTEPAELG